MSSNTIESLSHIEPEDGERLLHELSPTFETLYNRHLSITGEGKKGEWFPHLILPFDIGQTWKPDEIWTPDQLPVPESVNSALIVGLLTEDNLPWYTEEINRSAQGNEALLEWNRRWTAEEQKHGYTIRNLLELSRLVDPVQLERDRMAQVSGGKIPHPLTPIDGIAYVTFQELATQISHRNSGKLTNDYIEATITDELPEPEQIRRRIIGASAIEVMNRVAKDETLHYTFYRGAIEAALQIDPSSTVKAIYRQIAEFEMPGAGIRGFARHAARIAKAGVYDPVIHNEEIVRPLVVERWKIADLDGLDDSGKRAQEALMLKVEQVGAQAVRFASRHAKAA